MHRRTFLAASGSTALLASAGCLGDTGSDDPEPGDTTASDLDTLEYENPDVSVPLISTAEAATWHAEDDNTVFVDARTADEYAAHRITDALHSAAPSGNGDDDPVDELSTDTRLVTYCVCPHSLAGQRGATLIDSGFTDVYALDEGLQYWIDEGYPVEGDEVTASLSGADVPVLDYH